MDPHQRMVMEQTYHALHDARIGPSTLRGSNTSVFVGAGIAEHLSMTFADPKNITHHSMSGNALSVISGRVSYTWDLRGTSLTVDTACSSAMTAFDLAVKAVTSGESDVSIVSRCESVQT